MGESGTDVMNIGIILVLRAVGRRSDVRRGEDERYWALCHNSDPFMLP